MRNRKVLLIAYYFPPAGGGGVQRPTKFVKYLPKLGWDAIVLTATEDSFVETDYQLLNELPRQTEIIRIKPPLSKRHTESIRRNVGATASGEPAQKCKSLLAWLANLVRNWLLIPDSQIFWVAASFLKLRKILSRYEPDLVIATAPPYSAFLLGYLAKRMSGKPLVLDFRDPWSQWFGTHRKGEAKLRQRLEMWLEARVVLNAHFTLCVNQDMLDYFHNTYYSVPKKRFRIVYNGYDEEDFEGVLPKSFTKTAVVYTGKITEELYSALPFIEALKMAVTENKHLKENVEIHFIGAFDEARSLSLVENSGLHRMIKIRGYLPHRECVAHQLGADLLLLLLNPGIPEALTGKIFEYLRANKPILAVVPRNSQIAQILKGVKNALVIEPHETERISKELLRVLGLEHGISRESHSNDFFSRENQCSRLAEILTAAIQASP